MSPSRVGLVAATSSMALFVVSALGWLLSSDSDESPEPESSITPEQSPSTVLLAGWKEVNFHYRQGSLLSVELIPEHAILEIDLAQTAVFDCRSDCLEDVRDELDAVTSDERICLYAEAGRGVLKLWINRYTCPSLEAR